MAAPRPGYCRTCAAAGRILNATRLHLKHGGTLVYATCSILPEENQQQITAFTARTPDAVLSETGTPEKPGRQNLPGAEDGDGFFYAKLIKSDEITGRD